jgi:hypothetical protein
MTAWEIKATEFSPCNCQYSCPCQFSLPPSDGFCETVITMEVHEGHHGDVRLDGLRTVMIIRWPGPVHEGGGKAQRIVDVRADESQRAALLSILAGENTAEFSTHFHVLNAMTDEVLEPIFAPIDFEIDIEARTARVFVEGLVEATGEPIKDIVTGAPHRVRIDLPNGFEFTIAEIGSASYKTGGKIQIETNDRYGQFNKLHMNNQGVVR